MNPNRHVVLLGASVGRHWEIPLLPDRIDFRQYRFEYVSSSGFDKSRRLREILERDDARPDAILLKECAAYFPGDLHWYRQKMREWVGKCREHDVIPIPTTVVPVTRLNAFKQFLIDIIKRRNPFKRGNPFRQLRMKSITEYNDWIREFCRKNGLACLDLEQAVRYSDTNRYLREDLSTLDGLHLNQKAYPLLDGLIPITMSAAFSEEGPKP